MSALERRFDIASLARAPDGCPVCGSVSLENSGPLAAHRPRVFGGITVDIVLDSGDLLHCRGCDLSFRFPTLPQSTLTSLYEVLPSTVWASSEPRHYWSQVKKLMEQYSPNRTVLDVGCFQGDFLNWLPGGWQKFGVEPSRDAAAVAQTRGIVLVADSIDHTGNLPNKPGIITMFDVLEHLVDPFDALRRLTALLEPGGSIVALTGAVDSLPWRLFGSDYWYCALPEHVSFLTRNWFCWASARLGLSLSFCRYLPSRPGSRMDSLLGFTRLLVFVLLTRMRRRGISQSTLEHLPLLVRPARWLTTPWWGEADDHILVMLTKS